jgi:hypothetical protein
MNVPRPSNECLRKKNGLHWICSSFLWEYIFFCFCRVSKKCFGSNRLWYSCLATDLKHTHTPRRGWGSYEGRGGGGGGPLCEGCSPELNRALMNLSSRCCNRKILRTLSTRMIKLQKSVENFPEKAVSALCESLLYVNLFYNIVCCIWKSSEWSVWKCFLIFKKILLKNLFFTNTHNDNAFQVLTTALQCVSNAKKPYTLAGFEPGIFCSVL